MRQNNTIIKGDNVRKKKVVFKKKQVNALPVIGVDWKEFDTVKLWPDNPRVNHKRVKDLALLLATYGQRTPLSVWEKDSIIYKGNTTYKALKYLKGMTNAQWAKFTKQGTDNAFTGHRPKKVLVAWMHFKSSKEAKAYGVSDNKSGEWSDWDNVGLAKLVQEEFKGIESKEAIGLFGFKEAEFNELLLSETEMPDQLPNIDLQGSANVLKADYLVIEMPDKETRLKVMSVIGVDHFRNRVVKLSDFNEVLNDTFWKKFRSTDVGQVTYTPQSRKVGKPKKKFNFKLKRKK